MKQSRLGKSAGLMALAVTLVAGFEGLRTVAYRDPGDGTPTICYGETRGVKLGDMATPEQCRQMLDGAIKEFSALIDPCIPKAVPDLSYAAFVSVAYNIGPAAFCGSTMSRKARGGDMIAACNAITMWDKVTIAGKKVTLPGLTRRRAEEQALCLKGLM